MQNISIFIHQIAMLFLLIALGFTAVKIKLLKAEDRFSLVRLIMNFTLPLLIFTTFYKMETDLDLLYNSAFALFLALGAMSIMLVWSKWFYSRFFPNDQESAVAVLHSAFGNIVFLGFPLCDALLPGGRGLFFAAIFHLATDAFVWSWGVYLLQSGRGNKSRNILKHFVNPNTISFALAIVFMFSGWRLPEFADQALSGLGKTTLYLAMAYIGILLASTRFDIKSGFNHFWSVSLHKLLILPALVYGLYLLSTRIIGFKPDYDALMIVVIESAMPCMANIVVVAKNFGYDDRPPAVNAILTMVLALFTLPLIYYLFSILQF